MQPRDVGRLVGSLSALALATTGCGLAYPGSVVVALAGGGGGSGSAEVTVDGSVETLVLNVGTDGCVTWSTSSGCTGSLCNLIPGTVVQITCDDPILAEWHADWTLQSATWSAPSLQASGAIVVEPAANYVVPSSYGSIVTDAGSSAHVMHLDVASLARTSLLLVGLFDRGSRLVGCVKGVRVTTVETLPLGSGPRYLVPVDPVGLDFTALAAPDPHVYCIEAPVPAEAPTWAQVKCRYR